MQDDRQELLDEIKSLRSTLRVITSIAMRSKALSEALQDAVDGRLVKQRRRRLTPLQVATLEKALRGGASIRVAAKLAGCGMMSACRVGQRMRREREAAWHVAALEIGDEAHRRLSHLMEGPPDAAQT